MGRSISNELLDKSKEAMISAVQIYNNPSIKFKSEMFIITAIISWTYLIHAYYRKRKIDYRYYKMNGKQKNMKELKMELISIGNLKDVLMKKKLL